MTRITAISEKSMPNTVLFRHEKSAMVSSKRSEPLSKLDDNNPVLEEPTEAIIELKKQKQLAAQRVKERNDKYIEDLKLKRQMKQGQDEIVKKQKEEIR